MKPKQNKAYKILVEQIAQVVQQSRVHAVKTVQQTTNLLYWEIGKLIIERQNEYGWGASIVDNLSMDLQAKIGAGQSWSSRNLRLMRQLYEDYSQLTVSEKSNVKQIVSHLTKSNTRRLSSNKTLPNVKQPVSHLENIKLLVSEVPWGQNILILQKVKDMQARLFYLNATIKNGWSRAAT